jgi:8-oxo-dGTP pyrophosphatase MutT (NUDIX family)
VPDPDLPERRGGPQLIPRPDSAKPGAPAPWAHLPAEQRHVSLDRVLAALRRAGPAKPSPWEPPVGALRSAVLVPLFEDDGCACVVLTRRAQHLRSHKGEVAFPGGRQDDGESLMEAALREAREEIGLDTQLVEIVGELDHLATVSSNSSIVPYVGVLPGRPTRFTPNPDEVEAVFTVSLDELLRDDVFHTETWEWQQATGLVGERPVHFFELYGDTVWGATARILVNLLCIVTGVEHPG